jgi:beta-glucanase (GH16 family)
MKSLILKIKFSFLLIPLLNSHSFSQAASCIHGGGVRYLLDAYLGSVGACNCEKAGVILYDFPKCNTNPYIIKFEDNFDGNVLDTSKWEIQPWGQGSLKDDANVGYYSTDNAIVQNGICSITAKKETVLRRAVSWKNDSTILTDGEPNLRTYNFTSSNLWTKEKFFQGKYEIRCRMPKGNGFWPAFWMFGGKRWNEIDVFDNYYSTTKLINSIGHDFDGFGRPSGCNMSYVGFDFSQWHTFSCIFDFDKISFLVDDELIRVVHRIITLDGYPVVCGDKIDFGTYYQLKSYPIERMSIIINLALISEKGPGSSLQIDSTTPFPSSFDVDYVKMWEREPIEEYLTAQPNPTADTFKVNSNSSIITLEIHNVNGEMIYKSEMTSPTFSIDLSSQPNGIYFLTARLSNSYRTLKIIKYAP